MDQSEKGHTTEGLHSAEGLHSVADKNHLSDIKSHSINENSLDQGYYFQALFQEICNKNILSDAQIEKIQFSLLDLMGKEVERFTNDESTSIPVETAQELLQSITYCIGFYLKSITDMYEKLELLKQETMSTLFYRGMDAISQTKTLALQLLKELQKNCLKIDNYAYQDTILSGISEFFHDYNIEFGANELLGSIDYPLFKPVTDYLGMEYIYEYLQRLNLENNFISRFPIKHINGLLKGYDRESVHILVNVYELVLINSLGCEMVAKESTDLNLTADEIIWLQDKLKNCSEDELLAKLDTAYKQISSVLSLEAEIVRYTKAALPQLVARLNHNLKTETLNRFFISFHQLDTSIDEYLEDGIPMDDESLRELMQQIGESNTVTRKVALIREKVRSLTDLRELLRECFYDTEYAEVFRLMNEEERAVLKRSILLDAGDIDIKDYEPQEEWQIHLLAVSE